MAAAGDRDSAYGTVISMAPSHCQSTFVLQVASDLAEVRITLRVAAGNRAETVFKQWTAALLGRTATLHQLRHFALTHDSEDGASLPLLMTKSGHTSVRSLGKYARSGVEALAAGGAEAGILGGAASPGYRPVSAGSGAGTWLPASRYPSSDRTQRSGPAAVSGAAPLVSRMHSHMRTCSWWAIPTARITVRTSQPQAPAGPGHHVPGGFPERAARASARGPDDARVRRVRRECPGPRAFAAGPRSSDADTIHH